MRNNIDWALSRERFWGTPLNIWINDETGEMDVPASVAEILERNPAAFAAYDEDRAKTFFHGHSYTGNPLGCAAALANLAIFESEGTMGALQPKIRALWEALDRLRAPPAVGEVRGLGFMAGIELVADKARKTPFPPERRMGRRVTLAARRRGLAIRPLGDVIVLMPPYCVSEEEIAWMAETVGESIEEAAGEA